MWFVSRLLLGVFGSSTVMRGRFGVSMVLWYVVGDLLVLRGVVGILMVLVDSSVLLKAVVGEYVAVVGGIEVVVGSMELRVMWLSVSAGLQPFWSGNNSSLSSHPHRKEPGKLTHFFSQPPFSS